MRTSYKKNRPFDFKLIDLVEPNPVIYRRQSGLSNYETMKAKTEIWDKIAMQMGRDVQFCLMRWNNIRYQFQKELRRSRELCPKLGILRGSTWPYLERLRFLEDVQNKTVDVTQHKEKNLSSKDEQKAKESKNNERTWQDESNDGDNDDEFAGIDKFSDYEMDIDVNSTEHPLLKGQSIQEQEQQPLTNIVVVPSEYSIIEQPCGGVFEEIIYQDTDEEDTKTNNLNDTEISNTNMQKIDALLAVINDKHRKHVERRLMAYLLKCQLCSLMNQSVVDLPI